MNIEKNAGEMFHMKHFPMDIFMCADIFASALRFVSRETNYGYMRVKRRIAVPIHTVCLF